MKSVLIVGADSIIGSHVKRSLQCAGWDVYATTRRKEEVSPKTFFLDLVRLTLPLDIAVDVVFLCASLTKISQCEDNSAYAKLINQEAQITLAEYFLSQGSHVIFLSTNAVFDGHKPYYHIDDAVNPVTMYGRCKATVEQHLLSTKGLISILRLSKVLTSNVPLMKQWVDRLKKGLTIYPFDNLYVCPISIHMVSRCLQIMAEKQILGLTHLSGEKDVTYYDLAFHLANHLNFASHLVTPKSITGDSIVGLRQGPYASLDMQESVALFGPQNMSIQAVLKDCYLQTTFSDTID